MSKKETASQVRIRELLVEARDLAEEGSEIKSVIVEAILICETPEEGNELE